MMPVADIYQSHRNTVLDPLLDDWFCVRSSPVMQIPIFFSFHR